MKSPIIYYGAKGTLAEGIAQYIPAFMDRYIEPFFGSGGVFFHRSRWAEQEILNDLNGDVINFFRVLRDKPKKLIEYLNAIPHSRQEQREAAAIMQTTKSDLIRAAYFFVRINQSFNGAKGWSIPSGSKNKSQEWRNKTDPGTLDMIARRLRYVAFENYPALKVMKLYDKASSFFYLDPPYLSVADAAAKKDSYRGFDMIEKDHEELVAACLKMKGMIIISGYDHPIYDPLIAAGWRKIKINVTVKALNYGKNKAGLKRTEILWISPNIKQAQNTLF